MTTDKRSANDAGAASAAEHSDIPQYEIRVKGHLGHRWAAWFDGLSITALDDGTTAISGPVADQAALHGLLQKLRDVGIPLVSLALIPPDSRAATTTAQPAPQIPEGN